MSGLPKEYSKKSKDGETIAIRKGNPHQQQFELNCEEE